MKLPRECLLDTNVPKTANLANRPDPSTDVSDACVLACVEAIEHVVEHSGLVIDAGDEIYDEYRHHLSLSGQPGQGDAFMKWVHDNRHNPELCTRVSITRDGETYVEFPQHDLLNDFDPSDRKFVAVANAHKKKPPIFQATDSKWWGWKDALKDVGITVHFLCPEFVRTKFAEKMGS